METLLEDLNSRDAETRKDAIRSAPDTPEPDVVDRLTEIVRDTNVGDESRQLAAASLGKIGEGPAAEFLFELVGTDDADLRALAAVGLGELKTERSMRALLQALTDKVNTVRNLAERGLLGMMDVVRETGVERLLELVQHPVPLTRSPAARLLGLTQDPRALEPLLKIIREDRQWLGRMWAAKALGDLGQAEAFEAVSHALQQDQKNRVRAAAAEAIGKLRTPESESLLKKALDDEDGGVRKTAEEALQSLNQAGFEEEPDPFAED